MSSRELSEWMAYNRIEPIGEERADLRAGIVASTVANTVITKASARTKPADFMPFLSPGPERANEAKPSDVLVAKFDALIGA